MYGKFKNNKIKSAEDEKQAKLDRVNQMKKIYLQPRAASRKTAGICLFLHTSLFYRLGLIFEQKICILVKDILLLELDFRFEIIIYTHRCTFTNYL